MHSKTKLEQQWCILKSYNQLLSVTDENTLAFHNPHNLENFMRKKMKVQSNKKILIVQSDKYNVENKFYSSYIYWQNQCSKLSSVNNYILIFWRKEITPLNTEQNLFILEELKFTMVVSKTILQGCNNCCFLSIFVFHSINNSSINIKGNILKN